MTESVDPDQTTLSEKPFFNPDIDMLSDFSVKPYVADADKKLLMGSHEIRFL